MVGHRHDTGSRPRSRLPQIGSYGDVTVVKVISGDHKYPSLILFQRNKHSLYLASALEKRKFDYLFYSISTMTNDERQEDKERFSKGAASLAPLKRRNCSNQFLMMALVLFVVVRIQIFNCNVLLHEYHHEMTEARHYELHFHKPRVLVGIFSIDTNDGYMFRQRHRTLFQTWNDTRICSLSEYKAVKSSHQSHSNQCEFVYTFVIGANPGGDTELLQIRDRHHTPDNATKYMATSWLVSKQSNSNTNERKDYPNGNNNNNNNRKSIRARDIDSPDITLLNIRENMNDGKSQSWIAYSSTILANDEQNDFDYIAKWDDDSILLLPEYFNFVYTNLPNHKPYNSMFFVGTPFDKAHWDQSGDTQEARQRVESLYENDYNRVHVYLGGQVYLMSVDLAQYITQEAIQNNCSYCEGVEDHDIASIAFHATSRHSSLTDPIPSNRPLIKLMFVGQPHLFWKHPIKTNDEWDVIWKQERQRISNYRSLE